VAHELGHTAVATRAGGPVRSITLFVFSGVAQINREPPTAGAEFRIALAGPLVSLTLGIGLGGISWHTGPPGARQPCTWAASTCCWRDSTCFPASHWMAGACCALACGLGTATFASDTNVATRMTQAVAYLFILAGVYQAIGGQLIDGLWIAFIGWFLYSAAVGSWRRVTLRDVLRGARVEQGVKPNHALVPPGLTLEHLVNAQVLGLGERRFFVADQNGTGPAGMFTLHYIRAVPREDWPSARLEQVMTPMVKLHWVGPRYDLAEVLERLVAEDLNQVPVLADGRLVGLLTREDLLRLLQTRAELGV
jgi:CBS domain-containing protein/Zn-dependent protease